MMQNRARNYLSLSPESHLSRIVSKEFENYKFCCNSLLDQQSISPRKAQICQLVTGNLRSSNSLFGVVIDKFIHT